MANMLLPCLVGHALSQLLHELDAITIMNHELRTGEPPEDLSQVELESKSLLGHALQVLEGDFTRLVIIEEAEGLELPSNDP